MGLGVRERERLGGLGDEADEAFISPHPGQVDGRTVQSLGGKQFEGVVIAQDIDRADLGDDVRRDEGDDAVEASLWTDRLRHRFAEAAQQQARSSGRSRHGLLDPNSDPGSARASFMRGGEGRRSSLIEAV